MSEREAKDFIKQVKLWIVTGLLGWAATSVGTLFGFYYTTKLKIEYLEKADKKLEQADFELRQQHMEDVKEIKVDIREINQQLSSIKIGN